MGIIYILQKNVPGLGRLTKIGMTTRSGEDRAAEYGGGGWDVMDELTVSVADSGQLQEIESRIHDRMAHFRCAPAAAFGLTEVFTCSADDALAAARAEIGGRADDTDRVELLRQRTNKMVERKILRSHADEIARLHMGKYPEPKNLWDIRSKDPLSRRATNSEITQWSIHKKTLDALDNIGADATTFRAMLKSDMDQLRQLWLDRQRAADVAAAEQERAAERAKRAAEQAKRASVGTQELTPEKRSTLREELAAHESEMRKAQRLQEAYFWVICTGLVVTGALALSLLAQGESLHSVVDAEGELIWAAFAIAAAATAYFKRNKGKTRLAEMRRDWDQAHSDL